MPEPAPWLAWHREEPSPWLSLGAQEALRKQKVWSGTVIAHDSRARPALAGKHEGADPSDREARAERTWNGDLQDFANKGLEEL